MRDQAGHRTEALGRAEGVDLHAQAHAAIAGEAAQADILRADLDAGGGAWGQCTKSPGGCIAAWDLGAGCCRGGHGGANSVASNLMLRRHGMGKHVHTKWARPAYPRNHFSYFIGELR